MTMSRLGWENRVGRTVATFGGYEAAGRGDGYLVPVIPKTDFSFDGRASSTQDIPVATGIDSSSWVSGVVAVRMHASNATAYVRALQRLTPEFVSSPLVGRLSQIQISRLLETNPNAMKPARPGKPAEPGGAYGLGCVPLQHTVTKVRDGKEQVGSVWRMDKSGSWDGAHGLVSHYIILWGPEDVDSLSIALARNDQYRGQDEAMIRDELFRLYYHYAWDNDVDLF